MTYTEKKAQAIVAFNAIKAKGSISLKPKFTSHFFRQRKKKNQLDLTMFNQVIAIDEKNQTVEVEGLTTFYDLAKAVLAHGYLPAVVPELRNITIGGTIAGLGIESSSFKYGMVHSSVLECDVLTATGEVITCSREKNTDLFYGLPNSLGTLGYVLKCTFKIYPAKQFIKVDVLRYPSAEIYFDTLKQKCRAKTSDFIDGVIFSEHDFVIVEGTFVDELPQDGSAAQYMHNFEEEIYWQFLQNPQNTQIYFRTWDYLWRWDADAFWALNVGWYDKVLTNPLFRKTLGKFILKSSILTKLNHIYQSFQKPKPSDQENLWESILQDLGIDLEQCIQFFEWYRHHIAVYPLWICPALNVLDPRDRGSYALHNYPHEYIVDIGIYTGKTRPAQTPPNYYNRMLEKKILELKGMKGLYSESYFTEDEFWSIFDKEKYDRLKKKYDPQCLFPNMYKKSVGKVTL